MKTDLLQPDNMIIEKLNVGTALFLIAKGECVLDFRHGNFHTQTTSQNLRKAQRSCEAPIKEDSIDHTKQKILRQGQLFGEISLIYNCLTTASVIALKYCTIGKLMQKDFEAITQEHPQILQYIKEGIFEYNDKDMCFIKMALKQLPFLNHLQDRDTIFYSIIYSLDTQKMNAGHFWMRPGDEIDSIYIIEAGIVDVIITIGGKETVIERLFRGSVINYKNAFTPNSTSLVTLRFAMESVIKELKLSDLKNIQNKNPELNKAIQRFQMKIARLPIAPLDYILALPKKVYSMLIDRTREKMLFGKQDDLMKALQEQKDYYKKYRGLEMDDIQIA